MTTTWMQNIHERKPPPEGGKNLWGLLQRTQHNITSKGNPARNGKNHSLISVTKIVLFQDEEDGVMSPKFPHKKKSNITSIASKQTKAIKLMIRVRSPYLQSPGFSFSLPRESFDWQTDSLKACFTKIYYRSELPWTNRLKKITAQ